MTILTFYFNLVKLVHAELINWFCVKALKEDIANRNPPNLIFFFKFGT